MNKYLLSLLLFVSLSSMAQNVIASNSRGLYLGASALDPLMEVLNERGAVIIISQFCSHEKGRGLERKIQD